ncbi:hypothetical protein Taro_011565, partial [Colocasia esculenta]|nr:hypothetical protein [Colocasia esculenta]
MWKSSWWLRSCGTTTRSSSSSTLRLPRPAQTVILKSTKGTSLELPGVMWKSSWWLRSCGTTTRSSSSSTLRLLRPAQTVILKSTKVTMKFKRKSKSRMGMRPS